MNSSEIKAATNVSTIIDLMVNGERRSSSAATLADLLAETGYAKVATARNGDFVPERKRASTLLADGDSIEVVSPRQGG
jgi:sulfur carrier protein